jgi:hypothetical protein
MTKWPWSWTFLFARAKASAEPEQIDDDSLAPREDLTMIVVATD